MNCRADHIERNARENQPPTAGGAMDTSVGRSRNSTNEASAAKATSDGRRKPTGNNLSAAPISAPAQTATVGPTHSPPICPTVNSL